jgi:predicted MFS family arabinose efflux permease
MIGRGLLETLPIIAQGVFDKGPNELGLLTASAGAGAILASFAKAAGKPQEAGSIGFLGAVCSVLVPICVILVGLSNNIVLTAILVAMLGFATTFFATTMQSAAQLQLTDEFRGRVMSLWTMIAMGGGAIGALLLGAISEMVGILATFIALGGLTTLIAALILLFTSPFKNC